MRKICQCFNFRLKRIEARIYQIWWIKIQAKYFSLLFVRNNRRKNVRINCKRKTIHRSYFGGMHATLITIHIVHQTFLSLEKLHISHISNHLFHSLSTLHELRKFWCWTRVNTKNWKYLLLSLRAYERSQVSLFQTPVINSWSDLGKKASSSQRWFQQLPYRFSQREIK